MRSVKKYKIVAKDFDLAGHASSDVKKTLRSLGFQQCFVKRVCGASYEAEINIVIHSVGGHVTFQINEDKIVLDYYDKGPGIENIELAMKEGYSTACLLSNNNGFGAGLGLANIKRISDKMELTSSKEGTHLHLEFERRECVDETF